MSIQSEITRIASAKSDIADAIEYKGVTVPGGSKIDDMAALIRQIRSGGATIIETPDPAGGTVITIDAEQVVTVSPLSVTQNGTYTANTGYAYNPVTVNVPQTSNDFVVTITHNSQTDLWEPDKTLSEIVTAYNAGKTILTAAYVDGYIIPSVGDYYSSVNAFIYHVSFLDVDASGEYFFETSYRLDSNGVALNHIGDRYYTTVNADASPSDVLSGKTFFNSSGWATGSATSRTSSDLTISGATVTAPAGFYSSSASKSVASGTAGTPTATKGTVSNHSVTVTPSVTNTTGYITGSTKTGTAVTVSASELVSGTYSVTSSGTKDVTNYASASVPAGTATAPSSISGTTASVSTGTNTLTLTKTVSVTPNVTTAGYVSSGTAGNASVSLTANVTTKAAATITPGTTNQTIASGTYLTGTQTIAGDADLVAGNILSTANIFGVQGSVVIQHYYTGSTTPSSSLGSNGDIYLKTS